jgi:hypothetical protein
MTWKLNSEPVTPEQIEGYYGFVYQITDNVNRKKYIGRKYFTKAGYKTVKGKRKKIRKDSDWMDYWGSNTKLKEQVELHGKDRFDREILRLCKTRSETNYYELCFQIHCQVLLSDEWYNEWITAKISRKHLTGLKKGSTMLVSENK